MNRQQRTASHLYDLVFGPQRPEVILLSEGRLPDAWASDYCSALAEAQSEGESNWSWPRRLLQAVHFVACHLSLRYGVWCRNTGKPNSETEDLLGRLQMESELFLWNSVGNLSPFPDISTEHGQGIIEEPDLKLVALCLISTPILKATHTLDDAVLDVWTQEYRVTLSEIGAKWHAMSCWWKWLGLAIRFASFYLDLAFIPSGVQRQCESQCGLDPARIRATIERLRPHFAESPALAVIDLWLRLSHLKRDSSGFPCIIETDDFRMRPFVGVRTVSEVFLQAKGP